MSPAFLLLVPLLAVSFGYEPSSDSDTGYDYTVQVEPELVEQMQRGDAEAIEVNIPPEVTPIRRIRVVVGSESLPKRLRAQGSVEQTTYRQDVDASASPSIDLLAQTGPAGGFGRNSTGFNAAATRGSAPPPSATSTTIPTGPTTVPPMGTQYQPPTNQPPPTDVRGQLDAGFQAVENSVRSTTGAFGDTINSVGASGQQFIDSTRQALNDMVAPPDSLNRSVSPPPAAFDNDRYASNNVVGPPSNTAPAPIWAGNEAGAAGGQERSVLTSPQSAPQQTTGGLTQAERDYLDRIERDRQQMQRQQQQQAAQQSTQQPTTNFPQQPPLQPLPDRNQQDVVVSLGNRPRADNTFGAMPPVVPAPGQNSAGPALASPQTGDTNWMFTQTADRQNTPAIEPPTISTAPPQITTSGPAIAQQGGNNDVASWLESQKNGAGPPADNQPQQSSTPVWLLGWTIAIGSVATNLFQWLNIVDMRNKYRVALRRNSPNFSRSMAA